MQFWSLLAFVWHAVATGSLDRWEGAAAHSSISLDDRDVPVDAFDPFFKVLADGRETRAAQFPRSGPLSETYARLPFSREHLQVAPRIFRLVLVPLAGTAFIVTLAVVGKLAARHLHEAERRRLEERKVFRPLATTCVFIVITLFPMCSLASLLSLLAPRNTALLLLAARVYEAVALFAFFELLVCLMGNPEEAIHTMEQQEPFKIYGMPPLCCCYPCLPRLRMTRDRFIFARTLVLQYCVVGPLSYLLHAWNAGYIPVLGGAEPEHWLARHLMHNGLKMASTLLCFWGLMQLYVATHDQLQDLSTTRKFALIKAMLVLTELVNLGVTFAKTKIDLSDDPVYTEEVMANAWIQMTTCVIIAPLACLLPSAFPESDLAWLDARALLWPQELSKQRVHQVL